MVRGIKTLLAAGLVVCGTCSAESGVKIAPYEQSSFSPVEQETFAFPFDLDHSSDVTMTIYSADHDVIRVLQGDGPLGPGRHVLHWDGRDSDGEIVPDEAYTPVLEARTASNETLVVNPLTTGGQVIEVHYDVSGGNKIVYSLGESSRVLIRLGIKAGPMLRALANWTPKPKGRNVQHWDGFDADRLIDLREHPKLSLLLTTFTLPDHSVITYGKDSPSYREYRKERKLEPRFVDPKDRLLVRNDQRISLHHYLSRTTDIDPRVSVEFAELDATNTQLPTLSQTKPVSIKVDIHPDDRWALEQSLYEVAFFVDDEFVAEEEHGYVPINWSFHPTSIEPGKHRLTVNISGFLGQVGVASIEFQTVAK